MYVCRAKSKRCTHNVVDVHVRARYGIGLVVVGNRRVALHARVSDSADADSTWSGGAGDVGRFRRRRVTDGTICVKEKYNAKCSERLTSDEERCNHPQPYRCWRGEWAVSGWWWFSKYNWPSDASLLIVINIYKYALHI